MLDDKSSVLARNAELENRNEELGLERDRAARACEAAITRLTEQAEELDQASLHPTSSTSEDALKLKDAQALIASLMDKCVSLKKDKQRLKREARKVHSGREE